MAAQSLLTTTQVAARLETDSRRVRRLAARWGIGRRIGDRAWLFTEADLTALRTHLPGKPGRPKRA